MLLHERGLDINTALHDDLADHLTGYARYATVGAGGRGDADEAEDHDDLDFEPLERLREALTRDFASLTSEAIFTGEAWGFTGRYLANYNDTAVAPELEQATFLYRLLSGDVSDGVVAPLNAVRWRTHPDDFAAMVVRHDQTSLVAHLFHFGDTPRRMGAQFLRLLPGNYSVRLWPAAEGEPEEDDDELMDDADNATTTAEEKRDNTTYFNVSVWGEFLEDLGKGYADFDLPPRTLMLLMIEPADEPGGDATYVCPSFVFEAPSDCGVFGRIL